jgi:hypothetical protein
MIISFAVINIRTFRLTNSFFRHNFYDNIIFTICLCENWCLVCGCNLLVTVNLRAEDCVTQFVMKNDCFGCSDAGIQMMCVRRRVSFGGDRCGSSGHPPRRSNCSVSPPDHNLLQLVSLRQPITICCSITAKSCHKFRSARFCGEVYE